jgi:hypothetical protein
MDFGKLIEEIFKLYGPPGAVIAVLLFALWRLSGKYEKIMIDRVSDGVKIALAMERNTEAINALRELIKDRKP